MPLAKGTYLLYWSHTSYRHLSYTEESWFRKLCSLKDHIVTYHRTFDTQIEYHSINSLMLLWESLNTSYLYLQISAIMIEREIKIGRLVRQTQAAQRHTDVLGRSWQCTATCLPHPRGCRPHHTFPFHLGDAHISTGLSWLSSGGPYEGTSGWILCCRDSWLGTLRSTVETVEVFYQAAINIKCHFLVLGLRVSLW